jgi:hypothetical protein
MNDKIRRVRCGTKKCTGFIDTKVSMAPKTKNGDWQFHCSVCHYWNLLSEAGLVRATSKEQFDLERLSTSLRASYPITRDPAGGI